MLLKLWLTVIIVKLIFTLCLLLNLAVISCPAWLTLAPEAKRKSLFLVNWQVSQRGPKTLLVSYSCQCVLACHAGILGLGVKRMGAPESVEGYVKSPLFCSFLQNPGGGAGAGGVKSPLFGQLTKFRGWGLAIGHSGQTFIGGPLPLALCMPPHFYLRKCLLIFRL